LPGPLGRSNVPWQPSSRVLNEAPPSYQQLQQEMPIPPSPYGGGNDDLLKELTQRLMQDPNASNVVKGRYNFKGLRGSPLTRSQVLPSSPSVGNMPTPTLPSGQPSLPSYGPSDISPDLPSSSFGGSMGMLAPGGSKILPRSKQGPRDVVSGLGWLLKKLKFGR
jgi:hypothetical protein